MGERDNPARAHNNKGNRKLPSAKAMAKAQLETRTVFKAVLDNPFEVKWPVVPLNVQNALLARVSALLVGVAEYNKAKRAARPPRRKKKGSKVAETVTGVAAQMEVNDESGTGPSAEEGELAPVDIRPVVLDHIAVGINEITKRLEARCRIQRRPLVPVSSDSTKSSASATIATSSIIVDADDDHIKLTTSAPSPTAPQSEVSSFPSAFQIKPTSPSCSPLPLRAVFVCRADLSTPQLVAHLPALVAAANSRLVGSERRDRNHDSTPQPRHASGSGTSGSKSGEEAFIGKNASDPKTEPEPGMLMEPRATPLDTERIVLVPFPRGAEDALKETLGLKHAAVLALDIKVASDPSLTDLLSQIPTLTAPWLAPPTTTSTSSIPSKRKALPTEMHPGLTPTNIRFHQTTAPKDMRTAKASRAVGRAAAKAKHRAALSAKKTAEADAAKEKEEKKEEKEKEKAERERKKKRNERQRFGFGLSFADLQMAFVQALEAGSQHVPLDPAQGGLVVNMDDLF